MHAGAWAWAVPAAALVALTVAEAAVAARRGPAVTGAQTAARWAGCYLLLAVAFGIGVGAAVGWPAAGQFYTGYLTEYSLSLDNLFIFYVIMRWFAVPPARQHGVLAAGILLAFGLRSALIVAGSAAINQFDWLFYPLAGMLLWTAVNLMRTKAGGQPAEPRNRLMRRLRERVRAAGDDDGGRLIIWRSRRPTAGPLLLLAVAIGSADLLFAFDSIPALFGITTSAWLIVACNAFALSGLRHVYVLLVRVLDKLSYLNRGLAVICAFIAVKLLLEALSGSGLTGVPVIPDWLSLAIVVAVLLVTVTASAVAAGRAGRATDAPATDAPATDALATDALATDALATDALATDALATDARATPPDSEPAVLLRRFALIDVDGNGVWERADCEQLTRRLCGAFGHRRDSAPARALAASQRVLFDALLARMDANGDGQITPEEFTGSIGRAEAGPGGFEAAAEAAARGLIRVADQDGNALLDPAEYARLAGVFGAGQAEAARAFARLDLDGNGVLDTAELTQAIGQFFTSPDPAAPGNLVFGRL